MNSQRLCPFYGQQMEKCDIGFGYISPYHVEVIVRHCTSNYEACGKYQELATRPAKTNGEPPAKTTAPSGGLELPLSLDRNTATAAQHLLRTPLTSIRSFAEILLSYPIEDVDALRRFLGIIHDETERLAHAVDVLFGKAPAEAGESARALPPASPNTAPTVIGRSASH